MVETFRPGSNHVKSYIELSITLTLMSFNFHIFINYFFPLQLMIGGLGKIDLDDWKKHTRLKHCTAESHIVRWFWRAVDNFDDEMRARLLQFVTGSSRVPLQGFKALQGTSTLGFRGFFFFFFLGGGGRGEGVFPVPPSMILFFCSVMEIFHGVNLNFLSFARTLYLLI